MRSEKGFTLIELLVVILIIAILAAVAIPVFLKQREKAWSAQMQAALRDGATAIESYNTERGSYSDLNSSPTLRQKLAAQGFTIPSWATPLPGDGYDVKATTNTYCIKATHTSLPSGHLWREATYFSSQGRPDPDTNTCPSSPP